MGKTVELQSWFWHSSSADFEPATYRARSRPLAHSCRGLRYQLGLHCFDVAQSMMIHQPLMKRSSEAAIFLMGHFIGEKGTSYMYQSIFIVLLQHISFAFDSTLNSNIHCSILNSNFQVTAVKFLLQKFVLEWSKVCSGPEKRVHPIDQSECNIFGQNLSIFNPNWFKHQSFFDWYVYKPVDLLYK